MLHKIDDSNWHTVNLNIRNQAKKGSAGKSLEIL